jgi:hypothetical protein
VIGDAASAPSNDAVPLRDSWPQQYFRTALPRNAVFVNLSAEVAPAHLALQTELPLASRLHPTVAAILIGFADVAESEPTTTFGSSLASLVHGVRAAGARTVLLGTLPETLRGVAPYNATIADVARQENAVLVDLAPLHVTFVKNSPTVTAVPDRASQIAIGATFTEAYRVAGAGVAAP